jgi:tricorn protease
LSKRSRCVRGLWLFLASSMAATAAAEPTRLLRFPDVHGDRVVFTYGGDLWLAAVTGGTATRLTSHPGVELFARFSPDGTQIAFTGQYDGDEQVYVMPTAGGTPRRLSFYPAVGPLPERWGSDNLVYGWTPDGKSVLFRSLRDSWNRADGRLYTVPVTGGAATPLPLPQAGAGDFSPDGRQLLYSPLWRDFRTWKRYQGGWAQDLQVLDLATGMTTPVAGTLRTERDPMWIGDSWYFVSDRSGTLNLYRQTAGSDEATALTDHRDADVRWASSDGRSRIVYELAGTLRLYDLGRGSESVLDIRVPDDGVNARPRMVDASGEVESLALAPDASRVLVVARGDVLTLPVEAGVVRNLTASSTAHEREAAWSVDGTRVAYVSDASGEEELWIRDQAGTSPARQLTRGSRTRYYAPVWAADGKRIAVSDKDGRLMVVEVATGRSQVIADDPYELARNYRWSPDGRLLAYSLNDARGIGVIQIWDGAASQPASAPDFQSFAPAWSADGGVLYFLSRRGFRSQIDNLEFDTIAARDVGVYGVTLNADIPNPFGVRNDDIGNVPPPPPTASAKRAERLPAERPAERTPKVRFDAVGLATRVLRVPLEFADYAAVEARAEALFVRRDGPPDYTDDEHRLGDVLRLDIATRKERVVATGITDWNLSADGDQLLTAADGDKWQLIATTDAESPPRNIATSGLMVRSVPVEEWRAMFFETWRRFRDHFYVANMHGYEWERLRDRYAALLPWVAHRSDLNYVLGELIGELNASHAYIQGGDVRPPPRPTAALAGVRLRADPASNRYRVAAVLAGANEEPRYRSPLTEVGSPVSVGEFVLAIGGRELTQADDPYELMQGASGMPAEWRVGPHADGRGARTVLFSPITGEAPLLYLDWIRKNRARVNETTGNRVAYLHLPDMGSDGLYAFQREWYSQLHREALIVDVRGNGGGNVSSILIERLRRQLLLLDYSRNSEAATTYPSAVMTGPKVAIIDETTASDGDIFSHVFREAGLGPLIGRRTWGGVVGIDDRGPLLDGGLVFVPEFGTASAAGQWIIEGDGVAPDIEVRQDVGAVRNGGDPQLERAIAEVLQQLPPTPVGRPPRPPGPDKTR